jgi:diguanylate cyclase (GGDEF)-like protein/putative nucleotidyltransferase with HDIG domain
MASFDRITDELTGLKSHRYFMEVLDHEWHRSTRSGNMFSVIMMDLDGFKQVNDRHGNVEGDKVLMAAANLLNDRVGTVNVVARYGGDEFAIMMPEARVEQAQILAERLRAKIESDPYLAAHGVTASCGIATFPVHGPTQMEILEVANAGIHVAKQEGGNRVRVASLALHSAQTDQESQSPQSFDDYLKRFQDVMKIKGKAPSLMDTVSQMAFAIDAKDRDTQGHSQKVSRIAAQIARQMGLPDSAIEEIRMGGILHDIGKIGVPEAVLNKPSALTREEYELMKTHAVKGAKILEPLTGKAIENIRVIVRHHHERWDGTGYPDALKGENIPLAVRIVAVANAFDNMVSDLAYRRGRSTEEAVAELRRCSGTQFDPNVVEAFVRSLGIPASHLPPREPGQAGHQSTG